MANKLLLLATWVSTVAAAKIWYTSYGSSNPAKAGLSYLDFNGKTITEGPTNTECGGTPSWLDIEAGNLAKPLLYCVNEGWSDAPGLHTFSIDGNKLTKISSGSSLTGPVSTEFYGEKPAVAMAHYGGAGWSTFLRSPEGKLTPLQNETFPGKGPRTEQEKSHPHQAILDPTGKFLLFPDLGLDLTHVYAINSDSTLRKLDSIKAPSASGPRHGVFWIPSAPAGGPKGSKGKGGKGGDGCNDGPEKTFFFLLHELSNHITSYSVNYANDKISFTEVTQVSPQVLFNNSPRMNLTSAHAAEIIVSPDNKFVVASLRLSPIHSISQFDSTNKTEIPSDSIVTLQPKDDGKLDFKFNTPSGGTHPRHFTISPDGKFLVVANQDNGFVTIWNRDPKNGAIKDRVAQKSDLGAVNYVLWTQ